MIAAATTHRVRQTVAALLLAAAGLSACSGTTTSAEQRPPARLGTFQGATGTDGIDAFGRWLGRDLDTALTFLDYDTWEDIEGPSWFVEPWRQWMAAADGRTLVVSVAMLPGPWADDDVVAGELRAGAAGEYDQHFRTLARRLVANGMGGAILRIGWEANGGWYRWRASPDADAWVQYFRRIVDAMRTIEGSAFTIDWTVSVPVEVRSAVPFYPGDDVVDIVGVDVYDKSWQDDTYPYPPGANEHERRLRQDRVWSTILDGGDIGEGLDHWAKFADEHGKSLSVPEWGVVDLVDAGEQRGGLDNPSFVDRMADWIESHPVQYHVYFEWDSGSDGGDHRLSVADTAFPQAAQAFRRLFGGRSAT